MKKYFNVVKSYVLTHKILSVVALIVIIFLGNLVYGKITSKTGETRYVLAQVAKGTIVSSVTGSGQVSASNQLDIKPNVSGTITYIGVQPGSGVGSGQLLFSIDNTTAQKAVRDAQISLDTANLALEKLKIQNSTVNLTANDKKVYDDGFTAVSDTFPDLTTTLNGVNSILRQNNLLDNAVLAVTNASTYRTNALVSYYNALQVFQKNTTDYVKVNNNSPLSDIENIINETYDTTKFLSDAIKNTANFVDLISKNSSDTATFTAAQNSLSSYINTVNGHLASLLAAETNIKNNQDSSQNSNLDIENAQLTVTQRVNTLQDAKDNLANYYINAPFAGTMASVPVQKGDNASSGTILGTIITSQQMATISLNEVDIAKIQLGQKVTLTFDAVPDLTITGKVVQIDSIGTVSQGVVNYNVKMSFDTSDPRIKPGMTVNSDIITNVAQDVLTVPSSAVKTTGGTSYVQMFDTALPPPVVGVQGSPSLIPPRNQGVEVGISNGVSTEITSGLKEGDVIVAKTITSTSTTTTAPSILGAPGGGNRGGGAIRIGG